MSEKKILLYVTITLGPVLLKLLNVIHLEWNWVLMPIWVLLFYQVGTMFANRHVKNSSRQNPPGPVPMYQLNIMMRQDKSIMMSLASTDTVCRLKDSFPEYEKIETEMMIGLNECIAEYLYKMEQMEKEYVGKQEKA